MHGWAISERLHDVRATLQIPQGSLYPALHRLERGWFAPNGAAPITTARPSSIG